MMDGTAAFILGVWLFMGAACIGINLPEEGTNHWDYKIATEACQDGLAGEPK